MSAFVVDHKRLLAACTTFILAQDGPYHRHFHFHAPTVALILDKWKRDARGNSLKVAHNAARALFVLNNKAVRRRYPKSLRKGQYRFYPFIKNEVQKLHNMPLVELYKFFQCFLYQCEEFEDHNRPKILNELRAIEIAIGEKIIMGLPEYDKATWG